MGNLAKSIVGNDAELVVRMVFQTSKKMDIAKSPSKAQFISELYCNLSRISTFTALLVDEGLLPFLLHVMDTQPSDEVISRTTEALANMSINRKNRREISSSGIASRLPMLFDRGSTATKSSALLIMGNLLSSGLFHDKVANPPTISNILDNLLDIHQPKQFSAVAYCLCQLSKNEVSCEVLVQCSAVPIVLGFLADAPADSVDYLWTVLVNIAQCLRFFPALVAHVALLLDVMYEEVKYEMTSKHQQWAVAMISYHLSKEESFHSYLDTALIESFVKAMKLLFGARDTESSVQLATIAVLINLAKFSVESRGIILSTDLIELIYSVGLDDDRLNVRYVALLNIISNEESCCYRLLELGIHKLLVSMQDTFQRLVTGAVNSRRKKEKKYIKGQSIADLNQFLNGSASDLKKVSDLSGSPIPPTNLSEYDPQAEGELGKELTAAILHNIALKRPTLAPGVLSMVLSLSKNCMSLRVLHCIRALAMMSVHSKSKVALSKESRRIIPMLTVCMRSGCAEAEKVQHYAAIVLCNTLALTLDKTLLAELVKDRGAVEDLVVVALLRINGISTKEILGKTFFNLLGRTEVREALIIQRDLLSAILELAKIQYSDLLELCMRALYNITCELKGGSGTGVETVYAARLLALKVPSMVVGRLVYSSENPVPGSMTTRPIRLLLGMSLANMSFHRSLVLELVQIRGKPIDHMSNNAGGHGPPAAITLAEKRHKGAPTVVVGDMLATATLSHPVADALYRVYVLGSDEATYCSIVTLYNLSRVPECRVLANSKALDLVNEVLRSESASVLCRQLCASFLCNISLMAEFHEQLTQTSVKNIVDIMAAPQIALSIKMDALQAVYNLATLHGPSKSVFIQCDVVSAMWKLMKVSSGGTAAAAGGSGSASGSAASAMNDASQSGQQQQLDASAEGAEDEEKLFLLVSHTLKELCEDVSDVTLLRKMMNDGVMNIILKLAKIERVELKIDMSFCIYFLTRGAESMKVLKRDSVDILFWLTLQDMMGSHDLILRNVSRAMRSFSTGVEECGVLIKQDRFFNVLKELSRSKNEDVLWQTAGMLYNIMHVEASRKKLLGRGLIATIFELAASGYDHVKHVCSACLHMVPDSLPNIDDPMALDLILCLLEAQGDKFSEISEKPLDVLGYPLPSIHKDSALYHVWSNFVASWAPFTCLVEMYFTPAHIPAEALDFSVNIPMTTTDPSSISSTEKHRKMQDSDYNFVQEPMSAGNAGIASHGNSGHNLLSLALTDTNDVSNNMAALNIQAPPAIQLPPPGPSAFSPTVQHNEQQPVHSRPSSRQQNSPPTSSQSQRLSTGAKGNTADRQRTMLLVKSTQSLSGSSQNKTSLPLLKPPAKLPENTLEAIRKSSSGSRSNTATKAHKMLSQSATLPDFSASSFSYHPVVNSNSNQSK